MRTGTLRLILWPTAITLLISVARLVGELQGWVTTRSGGGLTPLGITWCVFVFGGWFGYRLGRDGATARVRLTPLWSLLSLIAVVASVMWRFGPLLGEESSEAAFEQLQASVQILIGIAATLALMAFALWPRLAWTMLCYALAARITVVLLTWLAKHNRWDTHYTKFGPPGIELDGIGETVFQASLAQLGFWVPFTIIGGTFVGSLCSRIGKPVERAPDR